MAALVVRAARPGDYVTYTRLFPELAVDDPPLDAARWLAEMAPTMLVACRGGAAIGYAHFQVMGRVGYVRHLAVAPSARRCGVGAGLMARLGRELGQRGATQWCLNVKPDNAAAIGLYEAVGMRSMYRSVALWLAWAAVPTLPADAALIKARHVEPVDDVAVETAMNLYAGQLAHARRRAGAHLVQLRDDVDCVVGIAQFEPHVPRTFPIRVERPTLIGPLLRTVRAAYLGTADGLHVIVEADAALARLLGAAGADVRMHAVHYRGPLPG